MAGPIKIPIEAVEAIAECLEHGSDATVKKVGDQIHVVEIRRKIKIKSQIPSIGAGTANRGE